LYTFLSAEEHTEVCDTVHEQRTFDDVLRVTKQRRDLLLDKFMKSNQLRIIARLPGNSN